MIKENKIYIKITSRNKNNYFEKYDYITINKDYLIDINDINKNSKSKITAICDICGNETIISIQKYFKNKSNGGYYGCKKCSKIKTVKTNNNKYGVDYPMQNNTILSNMTRTIKEKYGVDNVFQLSDIKIKSKMTSFKKYGFTHHLKNDEQLKKQETTNLNKYGFKRPSQNELIKRKISKKTFNLFNKYEMNFLESNIIDNKKIYTIKCNICNLEYKISEKTFYSRIKHDVNICTKCNPINSVVSGKEIQLLNFIRENYDGKIITSDRIILNGKEIDILLPDINLGFEFNGNYWHSPIFKKDDYHQEKVNLALNKNIDLIHIWEDMWDNNNNIIKEKIIRLINEKTT